MLTAYGTVRIVMLRSSVQMHSNAGLVDLIERSWNAHPTCQCGAHTTLVWRDGIVWLECSTLAVPPVGRVRRVLNVMQPHVHEAIVDVPDRQTAAA